MKRIDIVAVVKTIVTLLMILAGTLSVSHIIHLGIRWGLPTVDAWIAPLFIDLVFILGKLLRSDKFGPEARRIGLWMMIGGGTLSLTANVLAGHTAGQRGFGALVCIAFMAGEYALSKIKPAPTAEVVNPRREAALKAAATRKANAAQRAAQAAPKATAKKTAKPAAPRKPRTPKTTPVVVFGTAAAYV